MTRREFQSDEKPPLWKPWQPLNPEHYNGSWGYKESPADEKLPPWKPVQPLNPDHYNGSWESKYVLLQFYPVVGAKQLPESKRHRYNMNSNKGPDDPNFLAAAEEYLMNGMKSRVKSI
eukprot:1143400-Pelagomonas_calceolata.AAC.5